MGEDGNDIIPRKTSPDPHDESHDEIADELERQARETLRMIRETAGELGDHVRRVLDHAATLWDQAGPGAPAASTVSPDQELRARALARRWRTIDFLVDPDLPESMVVVGVEDAAAWRVELRERGETRLLTEVTEPYQGDRLMALTPTLPVWDYSFPAAPDVESGERRVRLPDSGMIGACLKCNGTGHQSCAHCEGKGFVECHTCHGRARVMCRRCRGRGRIADPEAERRARASKPYIQVHAERIATDAATRLADLSERLRQEYGVPLPPSANWVPTAPASGETIPCPDCMDGKIACACGTGKLVCEVCRGSRHADCAACSGSGRVIRYREVVRRFDTRASTRVVPVADSTIAEMVGVPVLRRASGDEVWAGDVEQLDGPVPHGLSERVWQAAQELAREHAARDHHARRTGHNGASTTVADTADQASGERRLLSRRIHFTRIPITRVEYTFAEHPFAFLAVGHAGSERMWADTFPPRWSRMGRFLKAVMRDLDELGGDLPPRQVQNPADVAVLEEYRARRLGNGVQQVRIIEEQPDVAEAAQDGKPAASPDASDS